MQKLLKLLKCNFTKGFICGYNYGSSVVMSLESQGDGQDRTQPRAVVTRFLSLHKKEFKSKTDVKNHRKFILYKCIHLRGKCVGELREVMLRKS